MSASTRKRQPRRKQRLSRHGNAAPAVAHPRARFRWRNRYIRGAVWVFLMIFVFGVVGVAVVSVRAQR